MVSKCVNPRCNAEFRYFGEGRLFEFTADSVKETSQLFWLCDECVEKSTLEKNSDGEVCLIGRSKSKDGRMPPQVIGGMRFQRAS
jgi:hypothetical protein